MGSLHMSPSNILAGWDTNAAEERAMTYLDNVRRILLLGVVCIAAASGCEARNLIGEVRRQDAAAGTGGIGIDAKGGGVGGARDAAPGGTSGQGTDAGSGTGGATD